jgi:hypothetical protein
MVGEPFHNRGFVYLVYYSFIFKVPPFLRKTGCLKTRFFVTLVTIVNRLRNCYLIKEL